jgi:hypothetical protein
MLAESIGLSSLAFRRQAAGSTTTYTLSQETPRRSTLPMHQLEERRSANISPSSPSIVRATCRAGLCSHSPTIGEWGVWGVSGVGGRECDRGRLQWAGITILEVPHPGHKPRPRTLSHLMTRALEVLAGRVEATLRASNVPWCVPDEPRCLLPYYHEGALLGLRSCRAKILGFTFRCSEDADQTRTLTRLRSYCFLDRTISEETKTML